MVTPVTFRQAAVLGCGLIGGSFARAADSVGVSVRVWDPDPAARTAAHRAGLDVSQDAEQAVTGADLVMLAGPTDTVIDTYHRVRRHVPDSAVITDTASVKDHIVSALGSDSRFVAGHPMAGRAASGFAASDPGLFSGCTWVLCPVVSTDRDAVSQLSALVSSVGAGRVVELDAAEHDRAAAAVSHLPQLAATLVAANAAREHASADVLTLAAGGFADTTRVAASPGRLWAPILAANRQEVVAQLGRLIVDAQQLHDAIADDAIADGDTGTIVRLFGAGNDGRSAFEASRR